jgi:DNA-binding NtrC family response regulator
MPSVLKNTRDDATRHLLRTVLRACDGNRERAWKAAGMPRSTFFRWLKRFPEIAAEFPAALVGRPPGVAERTPRKKESTR